MAVASASIEVRTAARGRYHIKNTFIEEAGENSERRSRASSAPPRAWHSADVRGRAARRAISRAHSFRSKSSGGASVISYISSAVSCSTQPECPASIVILNVSKPKDRNQLTEEASNGLTDTLKLSQTLALKSQGLRSVGALGHKEGLCCPCLMETRNRNRKGVSGEPCRLGLLCGRCHEDHDMKEFSAAQRDLRRRKRADRHSSLTAL